MHGACGIIDTACTCAWGIKFSNNFEKLKSYAKQRWYAKKIKNEKNEKYRRSKIS
jgi:hypothetical protein